MHMCRVRRVLGFNIGDLEAFDKYVLIPSTAANQSGPSSSSAPSDRPAASSAAVVASAIAAASAAAPPVVPSAVVLPAEPAVAASPAAISFIHNSLCSANATVCAKIPCGPARPCSSPFLEPAAAILCRDLAVISRPSQHNLVTGFCLVL